MTASFDPQRGPVFPPLLTGLAALEPGDLLEPAIRAAREGADGGTVLFSLEPHPWRVGLVLAPEAPLAQALGVAYALELATVDTIGALAPAELGITWAWPDILLANGAAAGRLRAAASTEDPDETPDWLVFSLSVDLAPLGDAPGESPDRTSLAEEGAFDLQSLELTEVWARHALLWLHTWMEGGLPAVGPHWVDRAFGGRSDERETLLRLGEVEGRFLGLSDDGALLLREPGETSGANAGKVASLPVTTILARAGQADPPRLAPAEGGLARTGKNPGKNSAGKNSTGKGGPGKTRNGA